MKAGTIIALGILLMIMGLKLSVDGKSLKGVILAMVSIGVMYIGNSMLEGEE